MNRNKRFEDIGLRHAFLISFLHPDLFFVAARCGMTTVKDFFYSQSALRPKRKVSPVVNIDHELDPNIPFTPSWVKVYLRFTHLWIGVLVWMRYHYGRKAVKYVKRGTNDIRDMYKAAAQVYWTCQSTTTRPDPPEGNKSFQTIHKFDPHLNCLPSLHVMVVTWAAYQIPKYIRELQGNDEDPQGMIAHLKSEARLITESILYVKQHSVNCIPAALFANQFIFEGFEKEYGRDFIRILFQEREPEVEALPEVSEYMVALYDRFEERWASGELQSFQDVLLEFLAEYINPSESNQ